MLSTSGHVGYISHWAVPFILLVAALVGMLYGRYELQREDGSPALSLSSYMAAVVLSIVALAYALMLPIMVIMHHTIMDVWHAIILAIFILTSLVITIFSWYGLKISVDSL